MSEKFEVIVTRKNKISEELGERFRELARAGYTAEEIAKILDLNESTVRTALIRLNEIELQ